MKKELIVANMRIIMEKYESEVTASAFRALIKSALQNEEGVECLIDTQNKPLLDNAEKNNYWAFSVDELNA